MSELRGTLTSTGQLCGTLVAGGLLGGLNNPAVQVALQRKSATPSTAEQVFWPDDNYDGLMSFTVEAIPDNYGSFVVDGDVIRLE